MPFEISWYIPKRVILSRLVGDVTEDDMHGMFDLSIAMLDEGQPPVHMIADQTAVGKFPNNLSAMQFMVRKPHPNMGWVVVVSSNRVARFLTNILFQVMPVPTKMVDTMDAALTYLNHVDNSIQDNQSAAM
ncbi:MAG: STAS/SEC14 domain-containing protein [Chloroflexi bacterium]|nr:MAG: STAS/SEC14 domain-containing protein [Chloroflexota bacterium]